MKLEAVHIKGFRSVADCEIKNCGQFNVFIGKNNSGKSNLLSAINAFFKCLQKGNFITIISGIGEKIDFFDRTLRSPIDITLIFSLTLAERDVLIRDIVTEAPQMKNAIDGIDVDLLLSITVSIIHSHSRNAHFSFVSEIIIQSAIKHKESSKAPRITLLKIGLEAALELFNYLNATLREKNDAEVLERLRMRLDTFGNLGESTSSLSTLRRMISSPDISQLLRDKLEMAFKEASSGDELIRDFRSIVAREQKEGKYIPIQENILRNKIDTFSGEEVIVPKYVINLLRQVASIKVLYLKEQRKPIGKEEAEQILSLKVERGGDETLSNIQNIVFLLLNVKIDAFKSRGATNAELDIDNFLVEVNGSGIREALRLVLDVLFEQPNILLVEEPETHLHPALEIGMMQYLKQVSSSSQVFITTHSTNLLDTSDMKNVYLVSKPTTTTQVQLVNFEEAEVQIPRELGIRLSSLFMFDRLVFVEGPSDAAIFRKWANLLNVNFSQSNVGFITMEGARNITHYASESTLSFLRMRQAKMWFIIDRDERDEKDIEKHRKRLEGKAVLKVLKKREVENYLISPLAILRLIREKISLQGMRVSEELLSEAEISKLIEECAEKLKQITIDKRVAKILCRPIYPSIEWSFGEVQEVPITKLISEENTKLIKVLEGAIDRVEDVYREQSEYVNRVWQSERLALVPGDHLLDLICQRYHVRFKKEIDGPLLAGFLTKEEIDPEIQKIIWEIGS